MLQADVDPGMETISVMLVHPYRARPVCPKCNWGITVYDRIRHGDRSAQQYSFCKGGLDSRQKVVTMFGEREMQVSCFGIFDEHIHLQCNRCSFHWLMQTSIHRGGLWISATRYLRSKMASVFSGRGGTAKTSSSSGFQKADSR